MQPLHMMRDPSPAKQAYMNLSVTNMGSTSQLETRSFHSAETAVWNMPPGVATVSSLPLYSTLLQQLGPALEAYTSFEAICSRLARPTLFVDVDGAVKAEESLICYDVPYAPDDAVRSLQLRQKLGLPLLDDRPVDPNGRLILDSFITPRRWRDPATGTVWVQHASPYPTTRIESMRVQEKFHKKIEALKVKNTGTCPTRTLLVAECFLEVIRQTVTECWERGLLLLHVYTERVAAQAAHREMFESRVGHAFRLALTGEKSVCMVRQNMAALRERVAALERQEEELKEHCEDFVKSAEEELLIAEKKHTDAMAQLKKEYVRKKNQLERLLVVPAQLP